MNESGGAELGTYGEAVPLVAVVAGVDFGDHDVVFEARGVGVEVVILCRNTQLASSSASRSTLGKTYQ